MKNKITMLAGIYSGKHAVNGRLITQNIFFTHIYFRISAEKLIFLRRIYTCLTLAPYNSVYV